MFVLPARAQPIGDVLDDDPVRTAISERLKNLIETLDAPLSAGEGSFFFQTRAGRENHVRKAAGVAEEDLLHNKEVELRQSVAHVVCIGIDEANYVGDALSKLDFFVM